MFGWFTGLSLLARAGIVSGALLTGGAVASQVTKTSSPPPACTPTTSYSTEKLPVPRNVVTKNSDKVEKGKTVIKNEGADGVKQITWKNTYYSPSGCHVSERIIDKEEIIKKSIDKVILKGTKEPSPTPLPTPPPVSNCDPNYTPCIPNVSYDLDCSDIGFRVYVKGYDKHRFDADGDGIGCESY
jgi:hypothetical protein